MSIREIFNVPTFCASKESMWLLKADRHHKLFAWKTCELAGSAASDSSAERILEIRRSGADVAFLNTTILQ
jgi:hypothetical protein